MANKVARKRAKTGRTVAAKRAAAKSTKPERRARGQKQRPPMPIPKTQSSSSSKPILLSGDNPQIAKGYGNAHVQAYIAAIPGWKQDVVRRLDAIIERNVPGVYKAVKWNSPLYGFEGKGWFLSLHCYTKFVKVTFFRGASLNPVPPGKSKMKDVRHFDVYEDSSLDEFASWVKQASKLPGQRM